MRIIARRERPHPGAQLRLTDAEGWRITCFATNTPGWRLDDLEVRHRQRARAEDRIRNLKDSGLRNLPFHGFAQNQIWLQIVALAADLLVWTQTLAFTDHPARRWEPKRLRLRLLTVAGRIIAPGVADGSDSREAGHGMTSSKPAGQHCNPPNTRSTSRRPRSQENRRISAPQTKHGQPPKTTLEPSTTPLEPRLTKDRR